MTTTKTTVRSAAPQPHSESCQARTNRAGFAGPIVPSAPD